MPDYTKIQKSVEQQIKRFGVTTEIRRYTGSYDPVEGNKNSNFLTDSVSVVSIPAGEKTFDAKFREAFSSGKRKLFLVSANNAAVSIEPGDFILFDSQLWQIGISPSEGGVQDLNPSGLSVLYTVGCVLSSKDPSEGVGSPYPEDDPEVVVYTTADEAVVVSENEPIDADGRQDGTIYIKLCDE